MRVTCAMIASLSLMMSLAIAGEAKEESMSTRITLLFDDEELVVRMNDSQAGRDFIAMLPLTLTFRDYNATEKIGDLPRRLSTTGSPPGHKPEAGDFTYYAPWGNLAVFYREFRYGNGLVPLGVVESGVEKMADIHGDFSVRIEVRKQ